MIFQDLHKIWNHLRNRNWNIRRKIRRKIRVGIGVGRVIRYWLLLHPGERGGEEDEGGGRIH